MFALIATLIQVVIILAHLLVYKATFRFLWPSSHHGAFQIVFKILFFILPFSFLAAAFTAHLNYSLFSRVFYTLAAIWLGFLMYFFFSAVFLYLLFGLSKLKIIRFSMDSRVWGIIFFTAAFLIGCFGVANASAIRVTRISLELPGMPAEWKGKKAVWVSDLHLGQILGEGFSSGIAGKIESLAPDVIFLGGDIWDGLKAPSLDLFSPLARMKAPYGIYFITGNHEEFSKAAKDEYIKIVHDVGITFLDGKKVDLHGIELLGVGYMQSYGPKRFSAALASLGLDRNRPSILLKHSPADYDVTEEAGITLQLSGHTHHGQMFPVALITRLVYKGYDYGYKKERGTIFYTSSGTGTWGPPLRIGTTPEIVLITFR